MKPEDLPSVEAVEVLEVLEGNAARVRVTGGRVVFLSSDLTPYAAFMPLNNTGQPLLLEDSRQENGPTYYVPASLFDVLTRAFDEARPLQKEPLSSCWKGNPADVPTVVDVSALPDGAARLHLADGRSVEVEGATRVYLSPDWYAPGLLCVMEGQGEGLYMVPDALRFAVMGALALRRHGEKEGQP